MLIAWFVCGLIIFCSTICFIKKKTDAEIEMNSDFILSMIFFALMGPTSIFMGSIVLNDFHN